MNRVYIFRDTTVEYEELHISYHFRDDSRNSISLYRKPDGQILLNMGPVFGLIKLDDPVYAEFFDADDFRDTALFRTQLDKADEVIIEHWNRPLAKDWPEINARILRVSREAL